MTEWARIANTTLRDYARGEEDATMRNRKEMALLKNRGRILYKQDGDGRQWQVKYRRAAMSTNDGEQAIEFTRVNRHTTAFIDYEGYNANDSFTKRERAKNRGQAALVKVISNMATNLMSDIQDQFAEEFYVDSSATGNSNRFSGLETMFAATQTLTVTSGVARTANAADPTGVPNDTYATIATNLAGLGGSWTTGTDINSVWPFGSGTAAYDAWSPLIVNFTSTAFDGSSTTWADNCVLATRFGIDGLNTRNASKDGPADFVFLNTGLYRQYKDKLDTKERAMVGSSLGLRSLGFKDVIEQDGVEVTAGYGVPASVGYILNFNCITMRSCFDSIFDAESDYDIASKSMRFSIDILGNFYFKSPRNFGKFVALA